MNQDSYLSIPNPQSSISNPSYDLDGNAISYPLPVLPNTNSTLTWDGENRLTSTTVGGITTTQQFDSTGRRISKTTGTTTRVYLYEGWNVIAEYERGTGVSPVLTLKKTYLWGTDLSGTMQGAGGVGGLLCESNISNPQSLISYPTYDGNGNISEYLSATGSVAAHFEYDPFGNTTINTDATNRFSYKFSTKPQDRIGGLYYYGYRYYDPVTGRWPSRDPIGERGGMNLYRMVGNDGINRWDLLGKELGFGPGQLPGPYPFPTAPDPPRELGVGATVSVAGSFVIGYEVSKSVVATTHCRICVTYTVTKTYGSLVVLTAGIGPNFSLAPPGGGLDGPSNTKGLGIAGGMGEGATISIDPNWDNGSGGGGFATVGPTFGFGAAFRFGGSFTGCAELYYYAGLALIVADNRARAGMGLPSF